MKLKLPFFDHCFDKTRMKKLIGKLYYETAVTENLTIVSFMDKMKTIGFQESTKAGISIGIDDLLIPPQKKQMLQEMEQLIQSNQQKFSAKQMTALENFQNSLDSWHQTSELLKLKVVENFESIDILNPVYMMAFSGARGNISQVSQLVGMRGFMSDPQGQIVNYPIRSNFREGLTLTEYMISCYGARKGLVDTAIRTADAGYLTRRLVDVAHSVVVTHQFCGTKRGVWVSDMKQGDTIIYSLEKRLTGRLLAQKIRHDSITNEKDFLKNLTVLMKQDWFSTSFLKQFNNKKIVQTRTWGWLKNAKHRQIDPVSAKYIAFFFERILIRSPLTCRSRHEICQVCYGWTIPHYHLAPIGEAVGIMAAQSIGEPGTQLTMRTFHTGGVFSGALSEEIRAPFSGTIKYSSRLQGSLFRTLKGELGFLTQQSGILKIFPNQDSKKNETLKMTFPALSSLFFKNADTIEKNAIILELPKKEETDEDDDTVYNTFTYYARRSGFLTFSNTRSNFTETPYPLPCITRWKYFSKLKPPSQKAQETNYQLSFLKIEAGQTSQTSIFQNTLPKQGDLVNANTIVNFSNLMGPVSGKIVPQFPIINIEKRLGLFGLENNEFTIQNGYLWSFSPKKTLFKYQMSLVNGKTKMNKLTLIEPSNIRLSTFLFLEGQTKKVSLLPNAVDFEKTNSKSAKNFWNKRKGVLISFERNIIFCRKKTTLDSEWVRKDQLLFFRQNLQGIQKSFIALNDGFFCSNYYKKFIIKELKPQNQKLAFLDFIQNLKNSEIASINEKINNNFCIQKNFLNGWPFRNHSKFHFSNDFKDKNSSSFLDIENQSKNLLRFQGNQNSKTLQTFFSKTIYLGRRAKEVFDPRQPFWIYVPKGKAYFQKFSVKTKKQIESLLRINEFLEYWHTFLSFQPKTLKIRQHLIKQLVNLNKEIVKTIYLSKKDFKKGLVQAQNIEDIQLTENSLIKKNLSKKQISRFNKKNLLKITFESLQVENITNQNFFKNLSTPLQKNYLYFGSSSWSMKSIVSQIAHLNRFEGEFFLFHSKMQRFGSLVLTNKDTCVFKKPKENLFLKIGETLSEGSEVTSTKGSPVSGQLVLITKSHLKFRYVENSLVAVNAQMFCQDGDFVSKNSRLYSQAYRGLQMGDIVQGIPKIEEFFEARQTKDGLPFKGNLHDRLHENFTFHNKTYPRFIATQKSINYIQQYILASIYKLYMSQGVHICDKHLEIIVRRMTIKVKVNRYPLQLSKYDDTFLKISMFPLPTESYTLNYIKKLDRFKTWFIFQDRLKNSLKKENTQKNKIFEPRNLGDRLRDLNLISRAALFMNYIEYEPIVIGITKAALECEPGFISAASFQETTRMLSKAAIFQTRDYLKGLKANVVLGQMIPAGTGIHPQIQVSMRNRWLKWLAILMCCIDQNYKVNPNLFHKLNRGIFLPSLQSSKGQKLLKNQEIPCEQILGKEKKINIKEEYHSIFKNQNALGLRSRKTMLQLYSKDFKEKHPILINNVKDWTHFRKMLKNSPSNIRAYFNKEFQFFCETYKQNQNGGEESAKMKLRMYFKEKHRTLMKQSTRFRLIQMLLIEMPYLSSEMKHL
jgi:hypothetical protein